MPIHLLPPEIASQIAAGEVIERPASVVKELLENAIDARASFISINVEGAGKRLVEVSDDGFGIPSGELPIAVERHATSKLTSADDLFRISTLGFRGEALASICSVARVTITSRTREMTHASRLIIEGGISSVMQAVGAPPGTVIRVEDLFFNVPARLKFLKSEQTERRRIDELVALYALAFPKVRIHLRQEGKAVVQTTGNNDRREILANLYGADVGRQMLEVISESSGIGLSGYISPISVTRSNRKEIHIFVNGRPIQDVSITSAVVQAYHTMLMVGRFPMGVLFIDISPEEVDVNVHPAKAEVRFRNPSLVFSAVQNGVRRALLAHTPAPGIQAPSLWSGIPSHSTGWWSQPMNAEQSQGSTTEAEPGAIPAIQPDSQVTPSEIQAEMRGVAYAPILRLVGQLASTYIVAEGPDGLYLIDQHAAHERVLYEEYLARRASMPSQVLLQPVSIDLPSASARLLTDQLPVLNQIGFQVEPFGPGSFIVRALPVIVSGMDPLAALRVVVEDFEEDETPLQAEYQSRLIARICKRAAIKAGRVLSAEEQRSLLTQLEKCQSPRTCPHGRPTMIHLSVDLLERQFGRKGPR